MPSNLRTLSASVPLLEADDIRTAGKPIFESHSLDAYAWDVSNNPSYAGCHNTATDSHNPTSRIPRDSIPSFPWDARSTCNTAAFTGAINFHLEKDWTAGRWLRYKAMRTTGAAAFDKRTKEVVKQFFAQLDKIQELRRTLGDLPPPIPGIQFVHRPLAYGPSFVLS
ncbi:hypothetical protein KEM48_013386 [Puccinia striiformis f. sp. tritici PST-130]|nr:hypothetical protein KEM48_013386 [Puccinia striiformis f. sp. tritici PST-130]